MSVTIADYGTLLKEVYLGPIRSTLESGTILLDNVPEGSKKRFRGNEIHIPLHTGRNQGVGARKEDVDLPTADKQDHEKSLWNLAYLYVTVELTGQVMAASIGNVAAFAEAEDVELKGAAVDGRKDQNRQMWGDGSGLLTPCGVTSATNVVVIVDNKFIENGMLVDILDMDAINTNITVQDDTVSANTATTMTIATSVTTDTGDGVYRAGVRQPVTGEEDDFFEMWGLIGLLDDSDTYLSSQHGITTDAKRPGQLSRDSIPGFRANILEAASDRNLTFALMDEAFDQSAERGGEGPDGVFTTPGGKRAYAALFNDNRRYSNVMQLKGGYKGLEYNEIGVYWDNDCHDPGRTAARRFNRMVFLNFSGLGLYTQLEWDWIPGTSGVLHKVASRDKFGATLKAYKQFVVEEPRLQTILQDVDDAGTDF